MDTSTLYILLLGVALVPLSIVFGAYLRLMRMSRLLASTIQVNRYKALHQLGTTTLLFVDMDCVRSNHAAHALAVARRAGIRVCLTTKGAARTAAAVRIGFAKSTGDITIVQGKEARNTSAKELMALLHRGPVFFAHLTPEDKVHLITHAQKRGEIVTLATTDTADVLPLEYANTGVVMANVSYEKQISDLVVRDGDITTLIGGIQTARTIITGNRQAMTTSLTAGVAITSLAVVSLITDSVAHMPPAISWMHVLVITIVGLLPAVFLAVDKPGKDTMRQSPHSLRRRIGHRGSARALRSGMVIAALAYVNYLWFFERNNIDASYLTAGSAIHTAASMLAAITAVLCLVVYMAHQRLRFGFFNKRPRHTSFVWLVSLLTVSLGAFTVLNAAFPTLGFALFGSAELLAISGAAAIFVVLCEFQRHNRKHHRRAVIELHHSIQAKSIR
jgi:magnesium-transporting ATPase (P-type)